MVHLFEPGKEAYQALIEAASDVQRNILSLLSENAYEASVLLALVVLGIWSALMIAFVLFKIISELCELYVLKEDEEDADGEMDGKEAEARRKEAEAQLLFLPTPRLENLCENAQENMARARMNSPQKGGGGNFEHAQIGSPGIVVDVGDDGAQAETGFGGFADTNEAEEATAKL